jgi:hypothetical protein
MEMAVIRVVPCSLATITDVSEVLAASIITAIVQVIFILADMRT